MVQMLASTLCICTTAQARQLSVLPSKSKPAPGNILQLQAIMGLRVLASPTQSTSPISLSQQPTIPTSSPRQEHSPETQARCKTRLSSVIQLHRGSSSKSDGCAILVTTTIQGPRTRNFRSQPKEHHYHTRSVWQVCHPACRISGYLRGAWRKAPNSRSMASL